MTEQPTRYQRSFGGMVGALMVIVLLVLALAGFRALNSSDPDNPAPTVGYQQTAALARQQAPFALVAPTQLPSGWRATTVRYVDTSPASWHLGMLTDSDDYVGLEQSDRPILDMVSDFVDPHADQGSDVSAGGQTWETWSDVGGDHAIVHRVGNTTTLVVGTVPVSDLLSFVSLLS